MESGMVEVVGIFPAAKCPPDVKELVKTGVRVVEVGIDELKDQKIYVMHFGGKKFKPTCA